MSQKISEKYLLQLIRWFKDHSLSDWYQVLENEKYFANFLDVKTFKFTNSATSALYIIFQFISDLIKKDDLFVIGPAFCHVSWINVCRWRDNSFEFVDVKKSTLSIDPDLLEDKVKRLRPDIVIFVDMAGYCNEDLYRVKEICKQYDCILVEDSANAFGQKWKDYAGTIGDFAIYSFSTPKLLSSGEGGAIVCKQEDYNDAFENLIYQGGWYKTKRQKFLDKGLNFSMNAWITQLLRYELEDIRNLYKQRYDNYQKYLSKGFDIIHFDSSLEYYSPSFFSTHVNDEKKIDIMKRIPTFEYKLYRNMAKFFTTEEFPRSQDLEDHLVYLPVF